MYITQIQIERYCKSKTGATRAAMSTSGHVTFKRDRTSVRFAIDTAPIDISALDIR